jgi:hypothetical protein
LGEKTKKPLKQGLNATTRVCALCNLNAFRSPYHRRTNASVRLFGMEIVETLSALDGRVAKHASAVSFRFYALF